MLLLWLFVFLPIIEIYALIEVGYAIGALWTISLILLTAMAGITIMRRQGAAALADLQASFAQLRDPTRPIANGAMILMAGALLIVPGFVTDAMGALLLIPPVRAWLIRRMEDRVVVMKSAYHSARRNAGMQDGVIDAEYEVVDEDDTAYGKPSVPIAGQPKRPPSGWTRG